MNAILAQHLDPELLSALIDEELDPAETREVQAHLGNCLHCRQRLDGLRRVASGLRALEREEVPASLDHSVRRRFALDHVAGGLRERLAAREQSQRQLPAQVGLGFALVLSLAAIGWLFADALERRGKGPVIVPLAPGAFVESPREVGGLTFEWRADGWRETETTGEPERVVSSGSEQGREILEAHPGLDALFDDAPSVVLRWNGELVALEKTPPPRVE
jgi:hypothetical protein